MKKEELRIVFMGTPSFAVPALNAIHEGGYNVVGVITAPDRASGRGRKINFSPVKEYALTHNLNLLQPKNLKDEEFISSLKALNANLQVVVAFRMLPKVVWDMPELGTFNLHASLLPNYRGAAPINHAIINGEKKSGLTTFFLDEKIDTGKIISRHEMEIGENESFGELHDRMMEAGSGLVIETIEKIRLGDIDPKAQDALIHNKFELKPAPKISKEFCAVDWKKKATELHNFIRGLSPYPGAYSYLHTEGGKNRFCKILESKTVDADDSGSPGQILTDEKTYLRVCTGKGLIEIRRLQLEGKKQMRADEFLRGFKLKSGYFFS